MKRLLTPSKMKITGGLVRTVSGKRDATIELNLYKVLGRAFNEKNNNYEVQPEYNQAFLRSSIEYLSGRLKTNGYLFLNDALDELGFEIEPAGQVLGWHAEDGPLGIAVSERNGQLWVAFNVHGVIVNRI